MTADWRNTRSIFAGEELASQCPSGNQKKKERKVLKGFKGVHLLVQWGISLQTWLTSICYMDTEKC